MKKISKEEMKSMKPAYGNSKIALEAIKGLKIGEDLFISEAELEDVNVHYLYVAMRRKGIKLSQKKMKGEGYIFSRLAK